MMIGFSSQATEDEIKAAWMYMEWMTQEDNLFTMQWGVEGENYTIGDDGLPVAVADYSGDYTQGYNNSKDYWCVTVEARTAGTIEDVIKAAAPAGYPLAACPACCAGLRIRPPQRRAATRRTRLRPRAKAPVRPARPPYRPECRHCRPGQARRCRWCCGTACRPVWPPECGGLSAR